MKPATIADYTATRDGNAGPICARLQVILDTALPDSSSKVWHAHTVWFLNDNPIVGYGQLKSCVRLMFWSGQSFETSGLTPDGSFKAASIRFTDEKQINADVIHEWCTESRIIQWDYKNIVKRKGRLERLI